MALIICPECGNKISDKAPACPYCGILQEDIRAILSVTTAKDAGITNEHPVKIRCLACGAEYMTSETLSCPKCHYPGLHLTNDADRITIKGDSETKEIIEWIIEKVGKNGTIIVEESLRTSTELRIVNGMEIDRGYISPYMVDPDSSEVVLKNPYILLTDKIISESSDIIPLAEKINRAGGSLLIIADDVRDDALEKLAFGKSEGKFNVVAVRAPGYGDRRKAVMLDIAILTGGTVISEEHGYSLKNASEDLLGRAKCAKVQADRTVIIDGSGRKEQIDNRIALIKDYMNETASDFDREKLRERLDKLTKGVAMIGVGGAAVKEIKEKKRRLENALNAEALHYL